ncbi:septum site-determining protein MinC [Pseudomaricurvus alkylphenolicus]|uniref:septum site-determining protein MinC n=1 Tax=Pseudomaricurvus alkylphenolicus TaxID=1306991 RepID=UPI0014249B40|nr:septum site-determining protein MinC [Pseudomaricurvus alkylphenolicus]NIB39235.1 septum site-determining protein MinC [Pseudomaricurvus alkylphenolicus]
MDSTQASAASVAPSSSFRLKGGLFPMTLLELKHFDAADFEADLQNKVSEAPAFFQQAPVVISAEQLQTESFDLDSCLSLCRQYGLIPVALRGGSESLQALARELNLAQMAESRQRGSRVATNSGGEEPSAMQQEPSALQQEPSALQQEPSAPTDEPPVPEQQQLLPLDESEASQLEVDAADREANECVDQSNDGVGSTAIETPPPAPMQSKIITTPVRSGQQVYAAGGDLIVMSSVSAGAEILADGNIHVYGALRGRALAGVRGDSKARIFCQSLEAELISIAGSFKLDEDLRGELWKKPAQASLSDEALNITGL